MFKKKIMKGKWGKKKTTKNEIETR